MKEKDEISVNVKSEWVTILITKQDSQLTIEDYLKEKWHLSKKTLHLFRMNKSIKINGETLPWKYVLQEGDKADLHLYSPEEHTIKPYPLPLEILYEDPHVLIINKPQGLDTHPSSPEDTKTLLNAVAYYFSTQGLYTKPRHVHRLDRDTSGAILFTKHHVASSVFDQMLAHRQIKRSYVALVHGLFAKKQGTISEPIGKDRHHSTRRRVSKSGQAAVTHFQVLRQNKSKNEALVSLMLESGRTHQIRVHLSYIGHPLIGDTLYGGRKQSGQQQALHAFKLAFWHPFTHEDICVTAKTDQASLIPYNQYF